MSTEIVDGLEAGKTYYARETDLAYATWAVRLISPSAFDVPSGSDYGRATFTTLDEEKAYTVYEQVGGSPAAVDVPVAFLAVDVLAAVAAEVAKIPRASSAVAAGAAVRRAKVAASTTTLDERLEPTP